MSTTDADREMFVATLRQINRETEKFIAEHDKLAAECLSQIIFCPDRAFGPSA